MHTPDINLSLLFWVCTFVVYTGYHKTRISPTLTKPENPAGIYKALKLMHYF